MKTFLMILVIVWFILGASVANDRGYFRSGYDRNCTSTGTAALTVVAGPINYLGVHPRAAC
jgi:hypothetical protein